MPKKGRAKILSEAEFKGLLTTAQVGQFYARNVALLYCSFGLGLRVKEIASLTIADVADEQYRLRDEICLMRLTHKSKKQHYAYLTNKKIHGALTEHLKNIEGVGLKKPLFQTQQKREFTPNALQKWFKSMYDKAGIVGASSHSGRRTFITRLINHGIGIKTVSNLAGHSSITTTSIYVEDNSDCLKHIADLAVF
jgi:integrase/recombinase XerD